MKRIWLFLYAQDEKEVDIQREGLTNHCRKSRMNIIGETVMIQEKKLDPDGFSTAINCAVENRCDYLATYTIRPRQLKWMIKWVLRSARHT